MKKSPLVLSLILAASMGFGTDLSIDENSPIGRGRKKVKKQTHPVSPRKNK